MEIAVFHLTEINERKIALYLPFEAEFVPTKLLKSSVDFMDAFTKAMWVEKIQLRAQFSASSGSVMSGYPT